MKQQLEALGWTCSKCSCPGKKGYDCVNRNYKGIVIQERGNTFKIIKNSLVIESSFVYQLEEKLKLHGIY